MRPLLACVGGLLLVASIVALATSGLTVAVVAGVIAGGVLLIPMMRA